jgi:Pectate lyase superfamily protein
MVATARVRSSVVVLVACALLASGSKRSTAAGEWDEEFVGPFPSWSNLQRDFGAKGDGVADDTAALQSALSALGTPGHSPVLYVPPGVYRVTRTVDLSSRMAVGIVGADPATTTLRWDGDAGSALVRINGLAYSKIDRLTFDGSGKAAVLVDQSWDCKTPHFDTGNQYADDVFRGAQIGIRGGNNNCGFAETSVWRSRFVELTTAGIALKNFNALDLWVWYSVFDGCRVGVTNDPGAGNYHVYNSLFRRSTVSDLYLKNTGGFNIRNNVSIGSAAFLTTERSFVHPATIVLQGNAITTRSRSPIVIGNQGPALLIDNVIVSPDDATPIAVGYDGLLRDGDALLVGNRLSAKQPFVVKGRSIAFDNGGPAPGIVAEPSLPPVPPHATRTVFEVPPRAGTAVIQRAIDDAVRQGGRSVVHLPASDYAIDKTLAVPAGADIQVVGDGSTTALKWAGSGAGPVLHLKGPSRIVMRDFEVRGGSVDAIVLDEVDQPGARVYLEQAQLHRGKEANLLVDSLNNLWIDARDFGHSTSRASVDIIGGPQSATGSARVDVFSGASCCNDGPTYRISNGASLLVRDSWYESGGAASFLVARGPGRVTIAGSRVSQPVTVPAFDLTSFSGLATLLADHIDSSVAVGATPSALTLFGAGIVVGPAVPSYVVAPTGNGGRMTFVAMRKMTARGSSSTMAGWGRVSDTAVERMLDQLRREQPQPVAALPGGVTDIRFHRVRTGDARVGVHIKP